MNIIMTAQDISSLEQIVNNAQTLYAELDTKQLATEEKMRVTKEAQVALERERAALVNSLSTFESIQQSCKGDYDRACGYAKITTGTEKAAAAIQQASQAREALNKLQKSCDDLRQ